MKLIILKKLKYMLGCLPTHALFNVVSLTAFKLIEAMNLLLFLIEVITKEKLEPLFVNLGCSLLLVCDFYNTIRETLIKNKRARAPQLKLT